MLNGVVIRSIKPPSPTRPVHNCFNAVTGSVNNVPTQLNALLMKSKIPPTVSLIMVENENDETASAVSSKPSLPSAHATADFNKSRGIPTTELNSPVIAPSNPPNIPPSSYPAIAPLITSNAVIKKPMGKKILPRTLPRPFAKSTMGLKPGSVSMTVFTPLARAPTLRPTAPKKLLTVAIPFVNLS